MRRSRALVLKKETLTELAADDLRAVAGGVPWTPWCYSLIEPTGCLSNVLSCDGACSDPM
jgi:hypothetical protein